MNRRKTNCVSILFYSFFFFAIPFMFFTPVSADETWFSYSSDKTVYDIIVDDNAVWCATMNGLLRFEKDTMQYEFLHGIRDNRITSIDKGNDGTIWAVTSSGLGKYSNGSWEFFNKDNGLPYNEVVEVAAAPDGSVLADTRILISEYTDFYYRILARWKDGNWSNVYAPDTHSSLHSNPEKSFTYVTDSEIWALEYSKVIVFDGDEWTQLQFPADEYRDFFGSIIVDSGHRLWLRSNSKLVMYDMESWQLFPAAYRGEFTALAEGLDGTVYTGNIDHNDNNRVFLRRYNGSVTDSITVGYGREFIVRSIAFDSNGDIWAGTEGGLRRYRNGEWTSYPVPVPLPDDDIRMIDIESTGAVWMITKAGATRIDGETSTSYDTVMDVSLADATSLAITDNDFVWVGTKKGLICFDGHDWQLYTTDTGLPDKDVTALVASKNDIWIGASSGITRFDGSSWTTIDPPPVSEYEGHSRLLAVEGNGAVWATPRPVDPDNKTISRYYYGVWVDHVLSIGSYYSFRQLKAKATGDNSIWLLVTVNIGTDHGPAYRGTVINFVDGEYVRSIPWMEENLSDMAFGGKYVWMSIEDYGYKRGGLYRTGFTVPQRYYTSHGLVDNDAQCVALDKYGTVWVGTKLFPRKSAEKEAPPGQSSQQFFI